MAGANLALNIPLSKIELKLAVVQIQDRQCSRCGSATTSDDRKGYANWYVANRNGDWLCHKCYSWKWRQNPENREHGRQKIREWKEIPKNHKRNLKLSKEWQKTPKGKASVKRTAAIRRIGLALDKATLTAKEWQTNIEYCNGFCILCNRPFTKDNLPTFEHLIALNIGGTHTADNVYPAHRSCNSKKHDSLLTRLPSLFN